MHASTHKRTPGVISSPGTMSTEGLTAKSFLTVVENSAAETKEMVFISDNQNTNIVPRKVSQSNSQTVCIGQ